MTIIHPIDDFFYGIFPDVKPGDTTALAAKLEQYYSFAGYKPKVSIDDKFAIIDINIPVVAAEVADYQKVVRLCEKGEFKKAKPILGDLINRNPSNSEYHRIMGQILSEEGDQDRAIDCLVDALRWDSKNHWALVMMGNIFAKYKNDLGTAQRYYDQAVVVKPDDNITINNIGANLMQQGKLEEAKKYFWEAHKIDASYPNTHYALGLIAEDENDLYSAFYSTCEAIKLSKSNDALYHNAIKQAITIAEKILLDKPGKIIVDDYRHELEQKGKAKILSLSDASIPTAAKLEIAENYERDFHRILFQPKYPAVEHLLVHELVHLQFVIDARLSKLNQLFVSNNEHRSNFIKSIESSIQKLKKRGIAKESVARYITELFDGINRQMYNTPIDLFIEDFIYDEFPELRPYQFLSLYKLIHEGVNAVTSKESIELSPPSILSKSKILNLVSAIQFQKLYGVNLIEQFKASSQELEQAKKFYSEYNEYKEDREPAEEYELINHWANDLKLDDFFEIVDEDEYRKSRVSPESLLASIEADPYDLESSDPHKQQEMNAFLKSHKDAPENMAVAMYMVDALNYFKGMPQEKIRKIAYDIALAGTQGFHPDRENYNIKSIPGKLFTGYHILAYYYVSWKLAQPDMLPQLKLPFDKEYEIATGFQKRQSNE